MKRILCVDDEPNLLQALERQLRKQFEIQTAVGPENALRMLDAEGPFAVVVSDFRMPGMNGIQLLSTVRKRYPDSVRIMLTGQADLGMAIAAINEGNLFQFLTKPCASEILAVALESALEQHRLICAERELLEQTVSGSIAVMVEILGVVNPPAFSRAHRIRRYVQHMVSKLNLANAWQYEVAAMLSHIGCVAVPPEIIDKLSLSLPLNPQEEEIFHAQSRLGSNLLARIPRLEGVAGMIGNQRANWQESRAAGDCTFMGGQLVRTALDLDEQIMQGGEAQSILTAMLRSTRYNHEYVSALEDFPFEQHRGESRRVTVAQLQQGMVVTADVRGKNGLLVLANGQEVTPSAIARLQSFARTSGIAEPLHVVVPYGAGVHAHGSSN